MFGNMPSLKVLVAVPLVLGFIFVGVGLDASNPTNQGPAFVGIACFLGIVARIAQAQLHQIETTELDIGPEIDHPED
tara:strand:+ start:255 stop:485 length:231 start_codon:yes stop_codon:yes gene_type:complete